MILRLYWMLGSKNLEYSEQVWSIQMQGGILEVWAEKENNEFRELLTLDKASPSNCLKYSLPFKVTIKGANLLKNMSNISHYISVISQR